MPFYRFRILRGFDLIKVLTHATGSGRHQFGQLDGSLIVVVVVVCSSRIVVVIVVVVQHQRQLSVGRRHGQAAAARGDDNVGTRGSRSSYRRYGRSHGAVVGRGGGGSGGCSGGGLDGTAAGTPFASGTVGVAVVGRRRVRVDGMRRRRTANAAARGGRNSGQEVLALPAFGRGPAQYVLRSELMFGIHAHVFHVRQKA